MRYLLEGSVRRAGRAPADQRAADRRRLRRPRLGRPLRRAPRRTSSTLQDQLTEQIVGVDRALDPPRRDRARAAQAPREASTPTTSTCGRCRTSSPTPPPTATAALRLLGAALALDPGYLPAHGYAAWCHEQRYFRGGFDPADRAAALAHAAAALAVNADDPQAMSIAAFVRANLTRDYDARRRGPRPRPGDERQLRARLRLQRARRRPQRARRPRGRACRQRRCGSARSTTRSTTTPTARWR